MKALILKNYCSPQTLRVSDIPIPTPLVNEVLVKVHATAVNDWDWGMIRGIPSYMRLICGLTKPKINIPGTEISGTIIEAGYEVRGFKEGDAVYADLSESGFGGFAEYVCVPQQALTRKPKTMSFVEATCIPHAGALAMQGLLDKGHITSGQSLLINGAGGGVGAIGVQIAHYYGVREIVGVDHGDKAHAMQAAGFTKTIDYTVEDFTNTGDSYDLILDTKSNRPIKHYIRSLNSRGIYVAVGGNLHSLLGILGAGQLITMFSNKSLKVLGLKPNKQLDFINTLYEQGDFTPIACNVFSFEKIVDAICHFGEARHRGKVVVSFKN